MFRSVVTNRYGFDFLGIECIPLQNNNDTLSNIFKSSWLYELHNVAFIVKPGILFNKCFTVRNMRLWVKHARQVVRVVSEADPCRDYLAGSAQKDCTLAILEEKDGVGLSILIDW